MNTGPKPGAGRPQGAPSQVEKTKFAYARKDPPKTPPEWVMELALLVDQIGQKRAGERIDYSSTTVCQVLSGSYPGDVTRVEEVVRGALMGVTVDCPALNRPIGRNVCLFNQKQGQSSANPKMARLRHACPICPNARRQGGNDAE